MIYFSHLLDDEDMRQVCDSSGMGIESIEFSVAENLDDFDRTLFSYEKRLDDMACRKLVLHGPFLDLNPAAYDSLVQEATRRRYEQAYEAAERLGADKLIFHSCFVPSVYMLEGWAERVSDFYNRFLEDKHENIQILMENVLDPYPEPLQDVAEQIGHPAFGICLDIGHAHCYSQVPCRKWLETLEPYIRHLHAHDNCGEHDSHLALGDGTLPLQEIERWLKKTDCTIECRTAEDVQKTYRKLADIRFM